MKSLRFIIYFSLIFFSTLLILSCNTTSPVSIGCTANLRCPTGFINNNNCTACMTPDGKKILKRNYTLSKDEFWSNDTTYVIMGQLIVPNNMELTIEKGTIVQGMSAQIDSTALLIVQQGGKLFAEGTPTEPIIFTSFLDNIKCGALQGTNLTSQHKGLWGGIMLLGQSPISDFYTGQISSPNVYNSVDCSYGGNITSDYSGILKYVSIRHAGASFENNLNDLPALHIAGVGNRTMIDYIEIFAAYDDGLDINGGNVNINNSIVWHCGDDSYDIEDGYVGTLTNIISIADIDLDHAIELDGPAHNTTAQCTIVQGTMKGFESEYMDCRKNAQADISNIYWFNFDATDKDDEFELDDDASSANFHTNGLLVLKNMEFNTTMATDDLFDDKAMNGDDYLFQTKMAQDNTIVTTASNTIGANTSLFNNWTLAQLTNVLNF